MASEEEVIGKVLAALNAKTGGQKPCSVCGTNKWIVGKRFFVMPLGPHPQRLSHGPVSMPLVPVICTHCGNTHLLNLRILGFGDDTIASLMIDEDGPAKS